MRRLALSLSFALLLACTREPEQGPPPAPPEPAPRAEISEPEPERPTTFVAPVPSAAAEAAHAFVQTKILGGPLEPHPLVHFTAIDDPNGQALRGFHQALRRLEASGEPAAKVRVGFYGSSSVAADRYTAYLRGYLQHRFGDGGVGFVALVPLWRWHRHNEVTASASPAWTIEHAQKEKTGRLDGHYGLLGAPTATTGSSARRHTPTRSERTPRSRPLRHATPSPTSRPRRLWSSFTWFSPEEAAIG